MSLAEEEEAEKMTGSRDDVTTAAAAAAAAVAAVAAEATANPMANAVVAVGHSEAAPHVSPWPHELGLVACL